MFRLIGFLIGSITSVLVILLIVGMPNFHFDDRQADQSRYEEALEKLRAKQSEFQSVTERLSEDVARVAESVGSGRGGSAVDDDGAVSTPTAATIPDPVPVATVADDLPAAESHWFSFWNPFRSEIAAAGFVSRLESVTGIDYRVVKVKTGVYEVAFEYRDDAERRDKLARISAATGLELPDS